jgi:hypothetical protein
MGITELDCRKKTPGAGFAGSIVTPAVNLGVYAETSSAAGRGRDEEDTGTHQEGSATQCLESPYEILRHHAANFAKDHYCLWPATGQSTTGCGHDSLRNVIDTVKVKTIFRQIILGKCVWC